MKRASDRRGGRGGQRGCRGGSWQLVWLSLLLWVPPAALSLTVTLPLQGRPERDCMSPRGRERKPPPHFRTARSQLWFWAWWALVLLPRHWRGRCAGHT